MYADGANPSPSAEPAPRAAAAPQLLPQQGEVRPKAGEGATAFSPASPSESPPSPPPSNPQSQIQNPESDSPTSDLPSDSVLLSRVAACDTDPEDLAEEFGIRFDLYIDWLRAPETVRRLNAILQARAVNHQHKQQQIRDDSLAELVALQKAAQKSDSGDAHIERRRLAIAILRFTSRPSGPMRLFSTGAPDRATDQHRAGGGAAGSGGLSLSRFPMHYRTRSRHIRTAPVLHEAPLILPPPERPNPLESPPVVTSKLLHRLQDSDNPLPGDGLRTLYNHFTPRWRQEIGAKSANDFAHTQLDVYHTLLAHHSAILLPTQIPPKQHKNDRPLSATQRAELIDLDGERWRLTLQFTRESIGHPWLIDNLQLTEPPPPDPAPCSCRDCVESRPPP